MFCFKRRSKYWYFPPKIVGACTYYRVGYKKSCNTADVNFYLLGNGNLCGGRGLQCTIHNVPKQQISEEHDYLIFPCVTEILLLQQNMKKHEIVNKRRELGRIVRCAGVGIVMCCRSFARFHFHAIMLTANNKASLIPYYSCINIYCLKLG